MKNSRYLLKITIILMLTMIPLYVASHPGRTDKNGGHWDRSTGIYHYHDGNYAGQDSSGSDTEATYKPFKPPYTPSPRPTSTRPTAKYISSNFQSLPDRWMGWVLLFAMLIYLFWFFLRMFLDFIQEYLENKRKKLRYYQDVLIDYKERHEQNLALLARIIHYKFAAIPSCYAIGWDGLPKEKDCPGWGDTFTVYKSKNGKKFHRLYGCCGATERCHVSVYRDAFSKQNLCCKKCCKNYCPPSMEWYDNYLEYYALLLQYKKGSKEERSLISFLNKENIAQKLRKLSIFSQRDIRKDTLELIIYYTSSLNREAFRFRNAAEKKIDKHMQRFNLKCLK